MNVPSHLQYTDHDEWVETAGDVLVVGITDYAQDQLGELVHVELPEEGDTFSEGDVVAEVESVKAVAEIYAPVSGTIVEVNAALENGAEAINEDAYAQWIYKIRPDESPTGLMSAEAYSEKIEA